MAKRKVSYVCSSCGASQPGWSGRCNTCGEWNTVIESFEIDKAELVNGVGGGRKLNIANMSDHQQEPRIKLQTNDLNTVLGGGLVAGGVVLLAGEPGIGKSTLLMQIAGQIANSGKVLYASGEESAEQVSARAARLGVASDNLFFASSSSANDIASTMAADNFITVIVDSIQTIAVNEISSGLGTISQITNSTNLLSAQAKASSTTLILVGHVTKEGSIAGPKVLEHVVDVVLHLEGNRYGGLRVLRSLKNRYGSTNEAAIFEMKDSGLSIVDNPSASLLEERQVVDGSVVLATLEGSRPVLVEVQALVNTTSYGYPKRATSGYDLNRLNLLIAMLERRTKLKLQDKDVFVNIVGGLKISDTAADLAIVMAVASAAKGMQLKEDAAVFGELGLSGEVRRVPWQDKRLKEIEKLGFRSAIGPKLQKGTKKPGWYNEVTNIRDALNHFLTKG